VLAVLALMAPSAIAQQKPLVAAAEVRSEPFVQTVPITGSVTSPMRSDLSASVAGLVTERRFDVGSRVNADDLLISLDPELARLQQQVSVATADAAQAELDNARRRVEEARRVGAGVNIAASEVASRESEVSRLQAELAQAQANARLRTEERDRHLIRAPFTGVIAARNVEVGEWVSPGDTLAELVSLDGLLLDFPIPQRLFDQLDQDPEIQLKHGSENDKPLAAEIDTWIPVVNAQTRTFLLRARAPPALKLQPGMSVDGSLLLRTGGESLVIPRDAAIRHPDGRVTAWVLGEANDNDLYSVREALVEVAGASQNELFVSSGLEAGQKVITEGNENLRPDSLVRLSAARSE